MQTTQGESGTDAGIRRARGSATARSIYTTEHGYACGESIIAAVIGTAYGRRAGKVESRVSDATPATDRPRLHQWMMIGAQGGKQIYARSLRESWSAALSAFQAAPRKTIIAENSIHTIKPIAAASPL
jgi:hypothetical protein